MPELISGKDLIAVRVFSTEMEALVAKSALRSFGIEALLSSDDCGGQRPQWTFANGIRLMVRPEDANAANDVLRSSVEPDPQE
jgi:hypothetical protein